MKELLGGLAAASLMMTGLMMTSGALAQSRYASQPPVMVSPDMAAPWVMQLQRAPSGAMQTRPAARPAPQGVVVPTGLTSVRAERPAVQYEPRRAPVQLATAAAPRPAVPQLDPKWLPQEVDYDGPHKPGTLIIDTTQRFLFLVQKDGRARRYGVGVGKPGFEWAGTHKVTQKKEWPDWRPPAEMIAREKKKGRILPVHMEGGPANPLGARALYLGSTLYRIHGTNQPYTIGGAVSSGCIRMRNDDVIDLYERVPVGATVIVK
jgi:lipoprotein-anchoring transpeptidase ErfK/SrfK